MCEKSASNLWRLCANVPGVSCVFVCVCGCVRRWGGGEFGDQLRKSHARPHSSPTLQNQLWSAGSGAPVFNCCCLRTVTTLRSNHPRVVGWKLNYWSDQRETNKTPCCPNMGRLHRRKFKKINKRLWEYTFASFFVLFWGFFLLGF